MKKALLYKKLPNKKVQCLTCNRKCLISPGQLGFCQTRINKDGTLYTLIYGLSSGIQVDPIEKKPVFHFKPGSLCFSVGTYGCNFRCKFCQNWNISYANASELKIQPCLPAGRNEKFKIEPEKLIKMAINAGADGIAFTYNEPAIWLEYCLDVFRLVKKTNKNYYTCWVTNGYGTKEAIDLIAPFLDIYRVDLKSFQDKFYKELIGIPKASVVFETTKYLHRKFSQIHIECVTNIVPGWNDDKDNLKKIALWIKTNLGPKTPWHVTRFYPDALMNDISPTPADTLLKTQKIGQEQGLKFVYIGNLQTEKGENTYCPKCQTLVIKRGFKTEILNLKNVKGRGYCQKCGQDLNLLL